MRRFWPVFAAALGFTLLTGYSFFVARFAFGESRGSRGKEIYEKRCTGCQALDIEKNGPHLRGVYGRQAGSLPAFPYSDALRQSGVVWDAKSLDLWLADPDRFVPDNDMAFRVASPGERAAIIGYLNQLSKQ